VTDLALQFLDAPGSEFLSPAKVAQRLLLPMSELAKSARVDLDVLSACSQSSEVQDLLRGILRVLSVATDTFDDHAAAIAWMMNEPVPAFRYETAYHLIGDGHVDQVVDYLDSIASGFVG